MKLFCTSHLKIINVSAYSKITHYLKDKVPAALSKRVPKPRYACFPPPPLPRFLSWPFHSSLAAEHKFIAFSYSAAGRPAASPGGAGQVAPLCCSAAHPQLKVTHGRGWKAECRAWPHKDPMLWQASMWLMFSYGAAAEGEGHFKWPQPQRAASFCLRRHLLELWLVVFRAKAAMVLSPPKCGCSFCLACLNEQAAQH